MPVPKFRSANPPTQLSVGKPYSYQFKASQSPTFGVSGMLPPGLTINSATGVLSGTPTTAGSYTFSITATNASGTATAGPFVMNVAPAPPPPAPPVFTAANPPLVATVGVPYSYDFNASGNPAPVFGAT